MDPTDGDVPKSNGGNARQRLKQLKTRWGVQVIDWDPPPELVVAYVMDDRETWKRWKHSGMDPKKHDAIEYELIESVKITDEMRRAVRELP